MFNSYPDIQSALNNALSNDEIRIDGTFNEKIIWPNTSNITLTGSSLTTAIISGSGLTPGASMITFSGNNIDNNTIIQHLTITDGNAVYGGGISCYNYASPKILNVKILNCTASFFGGGMYCMDYSSPKIENCFIEENRSTSWTAFRGGGGFFCYNHSCPHIINTLIDNNDANDCGGGLSFLVNSDAFIHNSTISSNSCKGSGGGVFINSSNVTFKNVQIRGNACNGGGGGLFARPVPDMNFITSDINIILENVIISGNVASGNPPNHTSVGGGIFFQAAGDSPAKNIELNMIHSVITGNYAHTNGGGYYFYTDDNRIIANISNSIIWRNSTSTSGSNYNERVIQGIAIMNITWSIHPDPKLLTGRNFYEDPMFVMPINGSISPSTQGDFHLTGGPCNAGRSPFIDICPDLDISNDIDGNPRPNTCYGEPTKCDIGAYENQDCLPDYYNYWSVLYVDDGDGTHIPVAGNGSLECPFTTIQSAIDHSSDGYYVRVMEGTYRENVNFKGKKISVSSKYDWAYPQYQDTFIKLTVIDGDIDQDGDGDVEVVTFNHGETKNSYLIGFTIQNGFNNNNDLEPNGAIECTESGPTLKNLIIKDNETGLQVNGSGVFINDCDFIKNRFGIQGGDNWTSNREIKMFNSTFDDNFIGLECEGYMGIALKNTYFYNNKFRAFDVIEIDRFNIVNTLISGNGKQHIFIPNSNAGRSQNSNVNLNFTTISGNVDGLELNNSNLYVLNSIIDSNGLSDCREIFLNCDLGMGNCTGSVTSAYSNINNGPNVNNSPENCIKYFNHNGQQWLTGVATYWLRGSFNKPSGFINGKAPIESPTSEGNYDLLGTSSCVGAGTKSFEHNSEWFISPKDDIIARLRANPIESTPDIGAYEIGSSSENNGIFGRKFNDLNNNGEWDEGEPFLANWPILVRIFDGTNWIYYYLRTDENGYYYFDSQLWFEEHEGLNPGSVEVSEGEYNHDLWAQTYPPENGVWDDFSGLHTAYTNRNFGNYYIGPLPGGGNGGNPIPKKSQKDSLNISSDFFSELVIFPNPSQSTVNVYYSIDETANSQIEFYDLIGKKIKSIILNSKEGYLQFSKYDLGSNGIYMCRLIVNGKLIKQGKIVILE